MRLLIVEDEALIAQRIERLTKDILGDQLKQLVIKSTFEGANYHLHQSPIDLLILDLNLNGQNGFQLLQASIAESFQTIVLSAYVDKAIIAYDYGVLDFIPKPFNRERLKKAFDRYYNHSYRPVHSTKYLAIKKRQKLALVEVETISYIKGSGNHSMLFLKNGENHLHDKSLRELAKLLPPYFERLHKSYIVNIKMIKAITTQYEIILNNQLHLPISRSRYKQIKDRFG